MKLLFELKCNIESETVNMWKPIHFACRYGNIDIVKFLMEQNCDVNSKTNDGRIPIHFACLYGHSDIVKLLVKLNGAIESETSIGWKPIHFACQGGHIDIVELLIEHNCDIEAKNKNGETPLDLAELKGHNKVVELITDTIKVQKEIYDSIINNDEQSFAKVYTDGTLMISDKIFGQFWFEIAFEKSADRIIKYFLDRSIDTSEVIDIKNLMNNNPAESINTLLWQELFLYKCIRDHNENGFQLICASVINSERKMIPFSFLETAAEYGNFVFIQEILRKSIFNSETWENAKRIALEKGHFQIYESILNRELLLKYRSKANLSILHTAVCDNDPDMVEYILNKGLVDQNYNHEVLGTALALSIILCHEKCMAILERFNVDCNTQNKYLQSPLLEAISNGMIEHCRYIIDSSHNINKMGHMGQTALHCGVIRGCEELCDQLIKKGADCNRYMEFFQQTHQSKGISNLKVATPLTRRENSLTLCAKFNKTIYPCFIEILDSTTVNSSDDKGNSLLHLSVQLLDKQLCNDLIQAGADVDSINKQGHTPLLELLTKLDQQTFTDSEMKIIGIVNLFTESHCNVNKLFQGSPNIFDMASKFSCERLLLPFVSSQNQLLEIDESLFRIALEKKFFGFCEALLDSVSKDHLERCIGIEIINMALLQNHPNLLKSFVVHANENVRQSKIESILYHLTTLGEKNCFDCLLNIDIMTPQCFKNGETLLTKLLTEKKFDYCQKIFLSETNGKKYVNLKNRNNQTPLQVAVDAATMEIVQYLIFDTEQLDNEDNKGRTVLIQLFEKISNNVNENQYLAILNAIKTIILMGGNIYQKTLNGITVIDFCSQPEARKEVDKLFKSGQKMIVEKEVERIVEVEKFVEKTCQICMNRQVDCVLDCGHIICRVCSNKIRRCPFCSFEPVKGKRIFF